VQASGNRVLRGEDLPFVCSNELLAESELKNEEEDEEEEREGGGHVLFSESTIRL